MLDVYEVSEAAVGQGKGSAGSMQLSAHETNSTQCTFLILDLAATDEQKSVLQLIFQALLSPAPLLRRLTCRRHSSRCFGKVAQAAADPD